MKPLSVALPARFAASPSNSSGIAFDRLGNIYIADTARGGVIWRLPRSDANPTVPFATGVANADGAMRVG